MAITTGTRRLRYSLAIWYERLAVEDRVNPDALIVKDFE
jgi:hypothetical protein